jgi:hypothetical protein
MSRAEDISRRRMGHRPLGPPCRRAGAAGGRMVVNIDSDSVLNTITVLAFIWYLSRKR